MPWQVGTTQHTIYSPSMRHGYGFSITTARGAPLLTVVYSTEPEAKRAEELIRNAIENAVDISRT
jgi:hypothetical protein